uniref:Splicing coactivator subunit-like n=1 Tax=Oryza sativa subsp. japonica TaxID=39947 RepID=Q6UUB1_ORYSJ|nr:hypothetical protein OSJNBa0074N12.24 [Oryza sativa Japonica Group]
MVAAGDHRRGGAAAERGVGRGKGGDGPRLTPGRWRRRRRRPERREAAARLGSTGSTAFRRSATETERWTRLARMRRTRRRRRRGGRRSGATMTADRSSAATAERESNVASSNPARRKGGERRKRTEEEAAGFAAAAALGRGGGGGSGGRKGMTGAEPNKLRGIPRNPAQTWKSLVTPIVSPCRNPLSPNQGTPFLSSPEWKRPKIIKFAVRASSLSQSRRLPPFRRQPDSNRRRQLTLCPKPQGHRAPAARHS